MVLENTGFYSLLPSLVVIVVAIITRRPIDALFIGSFFGVVLIALLELSGAYGFSIITTADSNIIEVIIEVIFQVLRDTTVIQVIVLIALLGGLIGLLTKTGSFEQLSGVVSKYMKSKRGALVTTYLMGYVIFVDGYLNALTLGSLTKGVTRKVRISKEKLAYIIDSTSTPICLLIPFSTWAFYIAQLLESPFIGISEPGDGLRTYISSIPFILYAWIAAAITLLVALRWLPDIGAMRAAEKKSLALVGNGLSEDDLSVSTKVNLGDKESNLISTKSTTADMEELSGKPGNSERTPVEEHSQSEETKVSSLKLLLIIINVFVPITALIVATIFFNFNAIAGSIVALIVAMVLFTSQRNLGYSKASEAYMSGITNVIPIILAAIGSFMLLRINSTLGLSEYIIVNITQILPPEQLSALTPAVTFLSLSLVMFATGSIWGIYAVTLPIVLQAGTAVLDVNMSLLIGAVVAAGGFGSHACFYSDTTIISARSVDCDTIKHAWSQLPYTLIGALLSFIGFIALGYLL